MFELKFIAFFSIFIGYQFEVQSRLKLPKLCKKFLLVTYILSAFSFLISANTMESVENITSTPQTMSLNEFPVLALPASNIKIKWRNICEENAKLVAEKLFKNLFVEHSEIMTPSDVPLTNVIEHFYQTFRVRLKQLVETNAAFPRPSLLKAMSVSKSDKGDDKMANDNSPAFTPDHCSTNLLSLTSGTANATEILSSTGEVSNFAENE